MNSATLRNVAIISTIIFFFSVGVEYGAFLPNVIEHFHNIGIQNEALLGIVLACYWFGCCISSNVLLLLIDTNYPLRPLLLVCCVLYIASGLLYLFAPSLWAVVFSKFFAGLGAGSVLAIEKDLSASTSAEEFAALRLRLHVSLACGWLLSPIFSVLGLLVSPSLASSEVVSSSFFVLCAILTVLGFTHLARNLRLCRLRDTLALAYQKRSSMNKSYGAFSVSYDSPDLGEERFDQTSESCSLIIAKDFSTPLKISDDVSSQNKLNRQKSEKHGSRDPMLTNSDEILETAEFFMGPQARMPQEIMPPDVTHNCTDFSSTPPSPSEPPFDATCYPSSALNFSRSATAVCQKYRTNWLCPQFLSAFLFGSLQAMLTPLTEYYFLFSTMENSAAQILVSMFGLLPLLVFSNNSNYLRILVAVGCFLGVISTTGLVVIGPGSKDNMALFSSFLLGMAVSCGTLFALSGPKLKEECHLSDRELKWLWCAGLVLGPLWTSSTVGQPKVMHYGHLTVLLFGLLNCLFI
ncbi:uncharacterized protein LOC135938510 isoform X2 [Cloeon dipterum]|uniref:uncharacterized protein LOC135938510 isoform X2 n=1 Tax=Cloeon dipterum TaxID=197152 RepID=UPI00321F9327